jgi:hypothetical protein
LHTQTKGLRYTQGETEIPIPTKKPMKLLGWSPLLIPPLLRLGSVGVLTSVPVALVIIGQDTHTGWTYVDLYQLIHTTDHES